MIGSEKVLFFMMNGIDYIKEYQNKLGFFSDPVYREIANEIVYYADENGEITVADFITYVNTKENIKDKVMEIVNDSINEEVTIEAMDEYINAVVKVMKKQEIQRLKLEMKKELDVDKKMKLAQQIAELKKEDV
jgi:molybdopterin-binding protein